MGKKITLKFLKDNNACESGILFVATNNLIANSTSAGGPISFVPRPHSHTQNQNSSADARDTSNHVHNGTTVNMNTAGSHGVDHSVNFTPNGILNVEKHYQPFIIMNYIMKI
jgi:hypothetical protein